MYQALYRKWRPVRFPDVLSQPHITTTLQNQVRSGTTAHAYLFTGSRGTGKTTCARILARAVNCRQPLPDGNPCMVCDACQDAEKGILSDLTEIDAASNNSVEDVRELRDAIVYLPERCRFKIYIIDEVHMLSASAFNALLKIMEEPPEYVKFILATTEVHKVPATIISRCQRYDFHRIRRQDIVTRLTEIAREEQISLQPQAAALMARVADGGMRDAISLLDRCAAYGDTITEQIVAEAAGTAGRDAVLQLLESLFRKDVPGCLQAVATAYENARDLQQLCEELILMQRDVMLLKAAGDVNLLHSMAEEIPALQKLASAWELPQIMQTLSELQSCREKMTRAVSKRTELEFGLIRICQEMPAVRRADTAFQEQHPDTQTLIARLERLEQQAGCPPAAAHPATRPQACLNAGEPKPEVDLKSVKLSDFQPLPQWAEILEECGRVSPAVLGTLTGAKAVCYANLILITAENPLFLTMFKKPENAKILGDAVERILGKRYAIRARCSPEALKPGSMQDMLERARSSGIPTTAVT